MSFGQKGTLIHENADFFQLKTPHLKPKHWHWMDPSLDQKNVYASFIILKIQFIHSIDICNRHYSNISTIKQVTSGLLCLLTVYICTVFLCLSERVCNRLGGKYTSVDVLYLSKYLLLRHAWLGDCAPRTNSAKRSSAWKYDQLTVYSNGKTVNGGLWRSHLKW